MHKPKTILPKPKKILPKTSLPRKSLPKTRGDMAKKVTIRDVYNGQTVSVYTHQDKIMSVSFLPMDENGQGHVLAASDKSGMIAIRSMTRGQVVSRYVENPKVEMIVRSSV